MPIMSNTLISTTRSSFAGGISSSQQQPVLIGQPAFTQPMTGTNYKFLPAAALQSEFRIEVDSGVDIRESDIISAIVLNDGVTPWPGLFTTNPNETFRVVYISESSAGPLAHRNAYVERDRGGGPTY